MDTCPHTLIRHKRLGTPPPPRFIYHLKYWVGHRCYGKTPTNLLANPVLLTTQLNYTISLCVLLGSILGEFVYVIVSVCVCVSDFSPSA